MGIEEYVTLQDAAKRVGVSRLTVYNWVTRGQLPAVIRGRTYLVAAGDVEARAAQTADQRRKVTRQRTIQKP